MLLRILPRKMLISPAFPLTIPPFLKQTSGHAITSMSAAMGSPNGGQNDPASLVKKFYLWPGGPAKWSRGPLPFQTQMVARFLQAILKFTFGTRLALGNGPRRLVGRAACVKRSAMKNPVTTPQPESRVLLHDLQEEGSWEGPQFEHPQAPCRLPCPPRSLGAAPAYEHPLDAPTLFAVIKQAFLLEPWQPIGQLTLLGYQEVPPQAVSLRRPPTRAWLLRLIWDDTGANGCPMEALVFLQEDELQLIWR